MRFSPSWSWHPLPRASRLRRMAADRARQSRWSSSTRCRHPLHPRGRLCRRLRSPSCDRVAELLGVTGAAAAVSHRARRDAFLGHCPQWAGVSPPCTPAFHGKEGEIPKPVATDRERGGCSRETSTGVVADGSRTNTATAAPPPARVSGTPAQWGDRPRALPSAPYETTG